jgi:hypothetical protein
MRDFAVSYAKKRKLELNELTDRYKRETGEIQVDPLTVAKWLRRKKLAGVPTRKADRMLAAELARAWRKRVIVDKDGQEVRIWLCAPTKVKDESGNEVQKLLWADLRECMTPVGREFLGRACKRLRESIQADIVSYTRITTLVTDLLKENKLPPLQGLLPGF